ncbi:MAG: hypothetical protein RUMPE_01341 [Eubacteriales bacterium SKADARSKE-1]|nr:hypothetical protein [Eubacteriales bacterium SKADARSKE-1]MDQ5984294.1 hypothetical protein [Eubacteriales bacterium SKADARSKE-1]
MPKAVDLTGQKFGRLTAIEPTHERLGGTIVWKCICECGNICYVQSRNLRNGNTQSCGCLQAERCTFDCVDGTRLNSLKSEKAHSNSGVKGIYFNKRNQRYHAQLMFQRKQHHLGYYGNIEDAKKARQEAEDQYFKPILEKYGAV